MLSVNRKCGVKRLENKEKKSFGNIEGFNGKKGCRSSCETKGGERAFGLIHVLTSWACCPIIWSPFREF